MKTKIIPALLEHSTSLLDEKIRLALTFCDTLHIDIIDSSFSDHPNVHLLPPQFFTKYSENAFLELHMMVRNPTSIVKSYAQAGFSRFIGHVEHMQDTNEFIQTILHNGKEPFLGVDLQTPIENVLNKSFNHTGLAGITVLAVKAGKSGQEFNMKALDKIAYLNQHHHQLSLEVDGGINETTAQQAVQAGAHILAATSYLFNTTDPASQYRHLERALS